MKYLFLMLGVIGSAVSLSVTNELLSDWNYALTASPLHPNFTIAFVWFVSVMCFMFAIMFAVERRAK